jgi:hypothetical protein
MPMQQPIQRILERRRCCELVLPDAQRDNRLGDFGPDPDQNCLDAK